MSAKVKELRSNYNQAKKLYHRAGKAAAGTKKGSTERREYAHIKGIYHKVGKALFKASKGKK